MESPDDLLKAHEALEILDVGWDTLDRWAKKGLIPYVQVGTGQRRYRRADVEALVRPVTNA